MVTPEAIVGRLGEGGGSLGGGSVGGGSVVVGGGGSVLV